MKISVIMPVLNEEPNVDKTMASLFAQTRLPDEIVVADGGSTDQTIGRIQQFANRGIPIRIVPNKGVYAGTGRNVATRVAQHDVLVAMDFGNVADPGYIEAFARIFESNPSADVAGGWVQPIMEEPFAKACAIVFHLRTLILTRMETGPLMKLVPKNFSVGGLCIAYRRRIWERANGFWEAAACCEDGLYCQRIRRIGGQVVPVREAIIHHHMAESPRRLYKRYFAYARWDARTGLRRATFWKLASIYAVFVGSIVAAFAWTALAAGSATLAAGYVYRVAWRKADTLQKATGQQLGLSEKAWSVVARLTYDAAHLLGNLTGLADAVLHPHWRRRTQAYVRRGEQ